MEHFRKTNFGRSTEQKFSKKRTVKSDQNFFGAKKKRTVKSDQKFSKKRTVKSDQNVFGAKKKQQSKKGWGQIHGSKKM